MLESLEAKLYVTFVSFSLKPLIAFNTAFNTAFQTTTSKTSTMPADVLQLLRSYLANFVNIEVIRDSEDLLLIDFENKDVQVAIIGDPDSFLK